MKKCEDCNYEFVLKDRIMASFTSNNTLECKKCKAKFSQSYWSSMINFIIPSIIYLAVIFLTNGRVGFRFGQGLVRGCIEIIIAFAWIILFILASQYWSKYKKK